MKGNEISVKELRADAVECLTKLHQTLTVKEYGKGTIRNYCQEMKLLFKYYNHKAVADIRQTDIEQYLQYIKDVDRKSTRLNSSHSAKSRMPSSA